MTDLSREQIEYWRSRLTPDAIKQNASLAIHDLCDMALRTHDAEADRDSYRAKFREAKQALRDVRPEIDSLAAGLYRSHVNPSDGIVYDEDVAHEISQLTELHERIVRLFGNHPRSGTEDDQQARAVSLREQALFAIEAWEGLYEREKQRAQRAEERADRKAALHSDASVELQRAEAEKQEYEEAAERWHDAWAKQHTQRQNAEAECERLRGELKQEQEKADEQHMAVQLGWRSPPEGEPTAAQIVEAQQWPIGSDAPHTPEQAHGDAMEWCHPGDDQTQRWALMFDDFDEPSCIFTDEAEARAAFDRATDHWNCHLFTSVPRRRLTASGVPEYQSIETAPEGVRVLLKAGIDNPPVVGTVTYYEENGPVSTVLHYNGDRLVGTFHATHWRPLDSGVPYVPYEVKRLPDRFRSIARKCQELGADSKAEAFWSASTRALEALASAPAVRDPIDILESNDWGLVPISAPTGGDDFDVQWTVVSYHMAEPKERVIGRGPTPRDALSDAAPF